MDAVFAGDLRTWFAGLKLGYYLYLEVSIVAPHSLLYMSPSMSWQVVYANY